VSGEDGGQIDLPDPGHDEGHSGHPFVKVSHYPGWAVRVVLRQKSEVTKKFSNHESDKKLNYNYVNIRI